MLVRIKREAFAECTIVEEVERLLRSYLSSLKPSAVPKDAITQVLDRLENYYDFECTGGPLKNCTEWIRLRSLLASAGERDR